MLKFLTHKLRTHSLNEDSVSEKVEEHDSGTESDDEADRPEIDFCTDVIMKWNEVTDISMNSSSAGAGAAAGAGAGAGAVCACPPDPDPLYDHHSSEEELEVETPVRFRTDPPREALKPLRTAPLAVSSAPLTSAPVSSAPCPSSPRRRRAPPPAPRRHRPALDFDKMQQLRVMSGARSWRAAGGAAGGELSVFCW